MLRGAEGFREVVDACRAMAPMADWLGLKVGHPSVGTHVHLGWRLDAAALRRVMVIAAFYEPALFSLVAPSRHRNKYVRPVRSRLRWMLGFEAEDDWADGFRGHTRKHLAVNPSHLVAGGYGTLEIRYHAGTLAPAKILQWISLWMRILAAAEQDVELPGDALAPVRYRPLTVGARGDVRQMCSWLKAGPALTQRLVARRDQNRAGFVGAESNLRSPRRSGARALECALGVAPRGCRGRRMRPSQQASGRLAASERRPLSLAGRSRRRRVFGAA